MIHSLRNNPTRKLNYAKLIRGLLLPFRGHDHTLLFEHLCQRSVLVHRHEDVTSANELLINI